MEIDIRNEGKQCAINIIRFANNIPEAVIPTILEFTEEYKEVWLKDTVDEMYIMNKEQALNLIKALHKAIELGWLK